MGLIGDVLSAGSSAVSGFSIGTWLKIGTVVVVALAIGGLYEYGQYEAGKVVTLNQQIGKDAQIVADDKANINALQQANKNWATAFEQYKNDTANAEAAYQQALKLQEKTDAQLAAAEKLLRSNPQAATAALNSLNDQLVGLLNNAGNSGSGDSAAPAAAQPSSAAAPGAAQPQAVPRAGNSWFDRLF